MGYRTAGEWMDRLAVAIIALSIIVLASAAPARAAGLPATASGQANATVAAPIAVKQVEDLDFGVVASNPSRGGTVVLAPGADRARYTGSARDGCAAASCPAAHSARFAVNGEVNRGYTVWTPASLAVAGIAPDGGPVRDLVVSGIAVRTDSRPDGEPQGRLGPDGNDSFTVGGTLEVPAGLAPVRYRVVIPVMLNYI